MKLLPEKSFSGAIIAASLILIITSSCISSGKKHTGNKVIEWIKFSDPKTGHEVWQLTNNDSASESFYFYAQSFTSDDRYVIFRSKRSGTWDTYRCDLTNGEITRLTSDENLRTACIHPDGVNMAFISGWKYYKLNVHDLKQEIVMDFTGKLPSKPSFRPTFAKDGRYTLVSTREENAGICLYRVDLTTGEILQVMKRKNEGFGHEQINPVDPNLITYVLNKDTQNNMKLPMHERARTRIIRVDKGTDEPYLMAPYGFRATHDSWSALGDRFFFFEKTLPRSKPVSIASIDLNGGDYTRHYTDPSIKLGHGTMSRDGKWFISDGQDPSTNPLVLLNLQDGKTKTICWPDASIGSRVEVHVHPNFSSSGNYAVFTSDRTRTNTAQVYVVPIKHIKDSW